MNRRYNDGSFRRVHQVFYKAADPMNQWIDFYLDILKIDGKRLTRKKASPAADKPVDDVTMMREGTEWVG